MFNVNRIMVIYDDEYVVIHLNGKETDRLYEVWDTIDFFPSFFNRINHLNNGKSLKVYTYYVGDIDICQEAIPLLYSVQQFTQAEEKAFIEEDWKTLEKLLIQRIEDGDVE